MEFQMSIASFLKVSTIIIPGCGFSIIARAYRAAEGGERACN